MSTFSKLGIVIIITGILGYLIVNKKDPIIVNETTEYIYMKEYGIFGDSSVVKYHKDIRYPGKVTKRFTYVFGEIGNGGMFKYRIVISFDRTNIYLDIDEDIYNRINIGDNVDIVKNFVKSKYILYHNNKNIGTVFF